MSGRNVWSLKMADNNATLTVGENSFELPIMKGSEGPDVIDIRKLYAVSDHFTFDPGFTSTASCESALTFIDGDEGILLHRGYSIEELSEQSSFMEVSYLLLNGELPTKAQLDHFSHTISRCWLSTCTDSKFIWSYKLNGALALYG